VKWLLAAALTSFMSLGVYAQAPVASAETAVLSFNEWKAQKIQNVQAQYKSLEETYLAKKKINPQDSSLKGLYAELKHTKESSSELNDLSVTDYFIGYLSQFKNKKSVFQTAISKLAPDEISELMSAYANSLLKTSGEGLSTAADNQKTESSKSY
jgi:hypothetical protein